MRKPKLKPENSRTLAISYLCGVNTEYLRRVYGVEAQTQKITALNRSKELEDPLIEFYKRSSLREKIRNSAHLYLSVNRKDVHNKDLVDDILHFPAYENVQRTIYNPRTIQLGKDISLTRYLQGSDNNF